jgi:hypothetical protein
MPTITPLTPTEEVLWRAAGRITCLVDDCNPSGWSPSAAAPVTPVATSPASLRKGSRPA